MTQHIEQIIASILYRELLRLTGLVNGILTCHLFLESISLHSANIVRKVRFLINQKVDVIL